MLSGFATLPKPASEIKDGSNAPVSGDAVHDYVENKIPFERKYTCFTASDKWVDSSKALLYGHIVYLYINLFAKVSIPMSSAEAVGSLISDIPKPENLVPITLIPDINSEPGGIGPYSSLVAHLQSSGFIYLQKQDDLTIPAGRYLTCTIIYVA
jgi:hypothetical protein